MGVTTTEAMTALRDRCGALPGLQSEVSSYQCAVCEVDVVFDLVG